MNGGIWPNTQKLSGTAMFLGESLGDKGSMGYALEGFAALPASLQCLEKDSRPSTV